ncbi:MAG: NUDIX domain-containing protein [Candidatus Woesearchaeota archaeon]|nr:MAG: NUDIX domain-containing protein [Candidatus Woesearchaeota archaeon]
MHVIQKSILESLKFRAPLSYNALWNKQGDSSKFAYHLRALEKKGFVVNVHGMYTLSTLGIKYSDYLNLPTAQPIGVVVLVVKREGKVLVATRSKFPFKGYAEFPASKVQWQETLLEAAKERLTRKLGLSGTPTYKGVEHLKTIEEGTLIMHHQLHVFVVEDAKGEPKIGSWVDAMPFKPRAMQMPHNVQTLKIALAKGFSVAFGNIIKVGDTFPRYEANEFYSWK